MADTVRIALPAPREAAAAERQWPRLGERLVPVLFLAPAMASLAVWVYLPLVESFRFSFYEWNLLPTAPMTYVGLDNYRRLLELPEMGKAALNTIWYTLGLLPLTVALPLAVALVARHIGERASALYRAIIFTPMIVAPVVVAIVWRWLLNPDHGVVNQLLGAAGLGPLGFLQNPGLALWAILFITGWKLVGFSVLLYAASLSGIDRGLVEAARLDGAGEWQLARHVFIPLLSPVTLLLVTLTLLHGAQWSFIYINVLTQGGPLQSTTNLYYLLWDYGFGNFAIGWSTAAGMILFAVFAIVAVFCVRMMSRHAFYES
jgi:multiple sugar transport system permease protein